MSFISELRQRKVFRVAIIYALAGWGVLQVADILVALAGFPDWVLRVVLALLLAGLPVAVLSSWVFKLTPKGLEREQQESQRRAAVAVLPFRTLDGGHSQDYLADGLTEELSSALAKVDSLRVPSRMSCRHFKGRDVDLATVAAELDVSHVLEGSVKKSDGRVHVTAELEEVASDSTIWAETYDRQLADIFAIQDEIAAAVVKALQPEASGMLRPDQRRTTSTEAYTAYLKGRHALHRGSADGCRRALERFEEAAAADPSFASAYAGMAQAYWWLASYGLLLPEQGFALARGAAEQALALDDRLAEAHLALGRVCLAYDWDFAGAEGAFRRALELEPADPEVHRLYGHFLEMMGREEEAIEKRRKAVELDPLSVDAHFALADTWFLTGHPEAALDEIRRIGELDPAYPTRHLESRIALSSNRFREALETIQHEPLAWRRLYISAIALHRLGDIERGAAALKELLRSYAGEAGLQIAIVQAQMGNLDQAFEWLERAYERRDPGLIELKVDPELSPLRADARYDALLQRIGLPR